MTLHQLPLANKDKVIIVGAGIGGLASSVRLSHLGYQVSVFEKAINAGGKLRTIVGSTGDIDVGPTVLTLLPIFKKFYSNKQLRTCPVSGEVMEADKRYI